MIEDRNLYPDAEEAGYDQYVPPGWVLFEIKNRDHVLFEHTPTGTLCQVEGDGLSPLVALDPAGDGASVHRTMPTMEDALTLAAGVMGAFHAGFRENRDDRHNEDAPQDEQETVSNDTITSPSTTSSSEA